MSEDQQNLVSVLYSVHTKLRQKRKESKDDDVGWQKAWREHTTDEKTLQEYSKAMHVLATKIWEPRNKSSGFPQDDKNLQGCSVDKSRPRPDRLKCRLEWVVSRCKEYFDVESLDRKLKFLDVGSCYNPFSQFREMFEIIALDLCPAPGFENEIFRCDFTELNVVVMREDNEDISTKPESLQGSKLSSLPIDYFDVIVFSYFLEYLADTRQRQNCCEKAYQLLAPGGLLFILRPDSSKVTPTGNNVLMKKLKVGMAILGFKRIYFEKLEHLWCMAFKKLSQEDHHKIIQGSFFKRDVEKVGSEFALESPDRLHELFSISQDCNSKVEEDEFISAVDSIKVQDNLVFEKHLLSELPTFHEGDDDVSD